MKKPLVSIICALAKNRAIGWQNQLLWHIPEDMQQFKKLTSGHVVIMGRKTFESIRRALPNRINIIVTRQKDYNTKDCFMADSLEKAIELAREKEKEEIFIIGGGEIYKQALPLADKLYLTVVDDEPTDADTFFPDYSAFSKVLYSGRNARYTEHPVRYKKDGGNGKHKYTFLELTR